MVSWGFAIKKGFIMFLWCIVWGIIGSIIAAVISGGSLFTFLMNPTAEGATLSLIGIMAGVLIGSLFSSILVFATIFKITMESTLEEAKKP
jgi:hypothetical protein